MSFPPGNSSSAERPIEVVLFDLDDTLYPQSWWLDGAWGAVAEAGVDHGIDRTALRRALRAVAAEGSDRGRIIDRALESLGASSALVAPLVDVFRRFEPQSLSPFPGVREVLAFVSSMVPIGLVTDGDPDIQRSKLRALRFEDVFDVIVLSDELGRSRRKPHPAALLRAAKILGVGVAGCVYIGDRPDKDVAAARAARMRGVRVRTGEYAWEPDVPTPWFSAGDVSTAIDQLSPLLSGRSRQRVGSMRRESAGRLVPALPAGEPGVAAE